MFPLPTVLALRNTRVHIGTPNCHDEAPCVEASVNDLLG